MNISDGQMAYGNLTTMFSDNEDGSLNSHRVAMTVVNTVSSLAGVVGNCLVLAVLVKNKEHFQGINLFIAALAIADLTVCIIAQPVFIYLLYDTFQESTLTGAFENNVFAIFIQMSLNLLFSIAIFRAVEISYPFFYRSFATTARMLFVIVFVCVVSAVQGILFNRKVLRAAEPYFQYATIISFLIIYGNIYMIARKHRNIIACQTRSVAYNHNSDMTETKLKRLKSSTVTTGIITGAFVICFLPFSIVNLIDDNDELQYSEEDDVLTKWVTTIVCCNSSMNAYIYTLRSKTFKNAFTKTLQSLNCF